MTAGGGVRCPRCGVPLIGLAPVSTGGRLPVVVARPCGHEVIGPVARLIERGYTWWLLGQLQGELESPDG